MLKVVFTAHSIPLSMAQSSPYVSNSPRCAGR